MSLSQFSTFPDFEDDKEQEGKEEQERDRESKQLVAVSKEQKRRKLPSSTTSSLAKKHRTTNYNDFKVSHRDKSQRNQNEKSEYFPSLDDAFIIDKKPDTDNLIYEQSGNQKSYSSKFQLKLYSKNRQEKADMHSRQWRDWELRDKPPSSSQFGSSLSFVEHSVDIQKGDFVPITNSTALDNDQKQQNPGQKPLKSKEQLQMMEDDASAIMRKRLNVAVQNNPNDIEAWMELVSFQDNLISRQRTEKEVFAMRERKVAILERALEKNPGNSTLYILKLRILSDLSTFQDILKLAEDFSMRFPQDPSMDLFILEHWHTRHNTISYSVLREKYAQIILKHQSKADICLQIFLRAVSLDYESGYTERALAMLFCILHVHRRLPTSMHRSLAKERLEWLEEWWESGKPFLGAGLDGDEIQEGLPIRSKHVTDETDPDSVVLFDEIRPFIFFTSSNQHVNLLSRFLLLALGFNVNMESPPLNILEDPLIHWSFKSFLGYWQRFNIAPISAETIFIDGYFEKHRKSTLTIYIEHVYAYFLEFSNKNHLNFAQLLRMFVEVDMDQARKFAQGFLEKRGFDNDYWRDYLTMEIYSGEYDQVASLCLTLLQTPLEKFMILRFLVEALVNQNKIDLITTVSIQLFSLTEVSLQISHPKPPPTSILACKKKIKSTLTSVVSSEPSESKFQLGLDILTIYILFIYSTSREHDLDEILEAFEEFFDLFFGIGYYKPGSNNHQLYVLTKTKILRILSLKNQTLKPSILREVAFRDACMFPLNTILFDNLISFEKRFKFEGKLQEFMKKSFSMNTSVVYFVFLFHMKNITMENESSIRSLCGQAVDNPNCSHSSFLWSLFLLFELQTGKLSNAKHILYKAIKACPFSREFYQLAFDHVLLKEQFTVEELRDLEEMMLGRELRLIEVEK